MVASRLAGIGERITDMQWKDSANNSQSRKSRKRWCNVQKVMHRANSAFVGLWAASIFDAASFDHKRVGFFRSREDAKRACEAAWQGKEVQSFFPSVSADPQPVAPCKVEFR